MPKRVCFSLTLALLTTFNGFAKDKTKAMLPAYVLQARTVAVMIDPGAGFSIEDPQANANARKDVEAALLSWGKYEPILSPEKADLIIVLRKGSGRLVNDTVLDPRQNNRPGSITSSDNAVSLGAQRGRSTGQASDASQGGGLDDASLETSQQSPHPQTEIGQANDSMAVYAGGAHPLDKPPAWKYVSRDGLSHQGVPAVDAFKKAVADAEKAAAKKP
jgi:hypothetical protein